MSRMGWIVVLVVVGVALAVVVGVLGTRNEPSQSKTEALSQLCTSLAGLETSLSALGSLSTSSSMTEVQSDLTAVQSSWNQVQTDLEAVQNAPSGELSTAWDDFQSAIKGITSAGSVSEAMSSVSSALGGLVTAAKSTASQVDCSGSAMTTTTTGG